MSDVQTGPTSSSSFALNRRRFLIAGAGATAAVVAGCSSSDGDSGDAAVDAADTSTTETSTADTVAADTTVPAEPLSAAAAALLAPGSPGLMDEATYQARVDEFLAFATSVDHSSNPSGINAHLGRAHREPDYVWNIEDVTVDSLAAVFDQIDEWEDTRDFQLMYLHWMLALGQGDTPMTQLSPDVIAAIDERMLANRYRYDDPLPADRLDNLWFWSENHRIINLAIEYLSGQRYPDETFAVTGLTGAEHLERAKPDILDWITERADLGFFEWHSNVYMLKNITPLLMLAELADDPEIVTAAAMALDLCLVDMAAHNHAGCYTAPRGRTYKKDKMSSLDEDTFGTAKFVFDDTTEEYQSTSDTGVTYFAVGAALPAAAAGGRHRHRRGAERRARTPRRVLRRQQPARGQPRGALRQGLLRPGQPAVLVEPRRARHVADGRGQRGDRQRVPAVGDRRVRRDQPDRPDQRLRPGQDPRAGSRPAPRSSTSGSCRRPTRTPTASRRSRWPRCSTTASARCATRATRGRRRSTRTRWCSPPIPSPTRRSRPIWTDDDAPGYWTGEASMPRSAQYRRTAVHIYQPKWDEATDPLVWCVFEYRPFTHAYVPQDHFDEVRQVGNWTIAAKDGGYIALWSWRTPTWREYDPAVVATNGMIKPFDLVAEGGPDNVWIVEVGSDDGGTLDDFIAAITAAEPSVVRDDTGFAVSWTSPSAGIVDFSSTGPFVVDGEEQPLGDFPRHESPWGGIEHLSRQYNLTAGDSTWSIDFDAMTRSVS